jgi:hypothetical protein
MELQHISVAPGASSLRPAGDALLWLAHDEDGARVDQPVGFGRQERALFTLGRGSGEQRRLAGQLPPYESLAVDGSFAYVWGPELRAVLQIDRGGRRKTIELDRSCDGGLWCDSGRILLRGEAGPGARGLFVLEQGSWSSVYGRPGELEWPDLQRIVVNAGAVFAVEHAGGRAVLRRRDLEGEEDPTELADLSSMTVRRLAAAASGVLVIADEGIFQCERAGALRCLVDAAESAPVDAAWAGRALVWLEAAVADAEGALVTPARVYAAAEPHEAKLVLETEDSITSLVGCSWAAAWIQGSPAAESLARRLRDDPVPSQLALLKLQ